MAKVSIKSEKPIPLGGIYFTNKAFNALSFGKVINEALGTVFHQETLSHLRAISLLLVSAKNRRNQSRRVGCSLPLLPIFFAPFSIAITAKWTRRYVSLSWTLFILLSPLLSSYSSSHFATIFSHVVHYGCEQLGIQVIIMAIHRLVPSSHISVLDYWENQVLHRVYEG